MNDELLSVVQWPAALNSAQELLIVAVDTPKSPIRDAARQLVRAALSEILGDAELLCEPGQAIRLAQPDSPLGISVSHENGLSLLAVHYAGPVGIDLLRIPESPDWLEQIPLLANDWLGPKIARQIAELPPQRQMLQFALAWTQHEARLKCRGLALEEWHGKLDEYLAPCYVAQLALPAGYVGAVATLKAGENPGA